MNKSLVYTSVALAAVTAGGWLAYSRMNEIQRLEIRSSLSDASATYQLGQKYLSGQGVAPDPQVGIRMIEEAAEAGNTSALVDMGQRYLEGVGKEKDDAEALRLFLRAAELGDSEGMLQASLMHKNGKGGWQLTKEKAAELLLAAAEAGNRKACLTYGLAQKDVSSGLFWTRRAAELGDSQAAFILGMTYFSDKDAVNGLYWYVKAIEYGNSKDAVEGYIAWTIAMRYYKGEDMPRNDVEAYAWLNIAGINSADYRIRRDKFEKGMDPDAIKRGQQRSAELTALIREKKAADSLKR